MDFKKLLGLNITEAAKKLGYWWRCDYASVNYPVGSYIFRREPCGYIELNTEGNIVVSEHHNGATELLYGKECK